MTLLPDKYDFTIWQGATFRTRLVSYTDEGVTLHNLTGYSALLEIKNPSNLVSVLYTLSTANNRIVLGGVAGTIDLVLTDVETAAITWKAGRYDLTISAPGGDTDPLLYGNFKVKGV